MEKKNLKLVPEHNQVITEVVVEHYEGHPQREETATFRKTKKHMHANGVKCWVDNGRCDGGIQIHHNVIEYSASSEVDWKKVQADFPSFTDVDQEIQMMGLCEKHHVWKGFGKHFVPSPIFKLQRYMLENPLDDYERAVWEVMFKDHDNKEEDVSKDGKHYWDEATKAVRRKR